MKVRIVYVYPNFGNDHYLNLAVNFLKTYHEQPPGMDHESIIVCNGNPPDEMAEILFGSLPNLHFIHHDNSGYDCGAYQRAAREFSDCDLMMFFGASSYLRGNGWLSRMVAAWQKHGNTLYGTSANRGHIAVGVYPHIRTTGFAIAPSLFNQYPEKVTTERRYLFEHGVHCLTSWIKARRLVPWLVSWESEYKEPAWDSVPGGYHNSDQHNLLCGDRMTSPPYWACW